MRSRVTEINTQALVSFKKLLTKIYEAYTGLVHMSVELNSGCSVIYGLWLTLCNILYIYLLHLC